MESKRFFFRGSHVVLYSALFAIVFISPSQGFALTTSTTLGEDSAVAEGRR